uniref:CRAL-TRIO domain-containing protein n=1 Tax=Panagrellus redivivus TaxID=6233 RepID=A0A7E4W2I5_PANRE
MPSNRYAVIDKETKVYLFEPTGMSRVILDAPTVEDAVAALRRTASPDTIKGVYILGLPWFESCRRDVEAVRKAGYTNIEVVEAHVFCISSIIYNLPMNATTGAVVFVVIEVDATILRKRENGWQYLGVKQPLIAYEEFPSVSDIVFTAHTPESMKGALRHLFPEVKSHLVGLMKPRFFKTFFDNRINNGNLNGYEVLPFCIYSLLIKFGTNRVTVSLDDTPPFTITKEIDIGDAPTVEVLTYEADDIESSLVKTFKFKSAKVRTVLITIGVDKTLLPELSLKTVATRDLDAADTVSLVGKANGADVRTSGNSQTGLDLAKNSTTDKPSEVTDVPIACDGGADNVGSTSTLPAELSQLRLDPQPKAILTFTPDNRILIQTHDETYTGDKEVLAYVRLQVGKPPIVGGRAFAALKKHPDSVFYGITRLLAIDFDPDHPDPSWTFKTSRDTDGKVHIHGGDDMTMSPIFLFGLVVKSTLLYIRENLKSDVTTLEIRLPAGSFICDVELKNISERIGVKLVVVDEKH